MGHTPKYLQHANIFVRNAERSRQWYEDILGLHTYDFVPGRVAFMAADLEQSHEVALVEIGEDALGPEKGRVGLNHTGWQMHSLDDLKELYIRLKEKNVDIYQVADHGISIGIYFRDPDGNGVEVSYELPRSEWHSQTGIFFGETNVKGHFPGPWENELAQAVTGSNVRVPSVR